MLISLASYFRKIELESFFGSSFAEDTLPEPHYNQRPGHSLVTVSLGNSSGDLELSELRWGVEDMTDKGAGSAVERIKPDEDPLARPGSSPCVVPVSVFYMWKNGDIKDQPFFVRMMNLPFMPVAAVARQGSLQLLLNSANTLVAPMSEVMPLVLPADLALNWIEKEAPLTELADRADKAFSITDFTVLKVSKKVSDPSNNRPDLIQPLPK